MPSSVDGVPSSVDGVPSSVDGVSSSLILNLPLPIRSWETGTTRTLAAEVTLAMYTVKCSSSVSESWRASNNRIVSVVVRL